MSLLYLVSSIISLHSLSEALRKDPHSSDFLESLEDILPALAPVFDRAPKYAWIAKQLLEPERAIQFRVVRSSKYIILRVLVYSCSYERMINRCSPNQAVGLLVIAIFVVTFPKKILKLRTYHTYTGNRVLWC